MNESCEILQDIIENAISNQHRDQCTMFVAVTMNFLKNQFKNHITIDDDKVCFHGFQYALSRGMPKRDNTNDNGCKCPFFVCHHVKNPVRTNVNIESDREHVRDDAIRVIDGISKKFNFFMGYQTRCKSSSTFLMKQNLIPIRI